MALRPVDIDDITRIVNTGDAILKTQELKSRSPQNRKGAGLFKPQQTEAMVGRSSSTINKLELESLEAYNNGTPENALFPPCERSAAGHRIGYSLETINLLRNHFSTAPKFKLKDVAMIIAVQNFKGGVTKSSSTVIIAHLLALIGFRVLVVDQDSQATTTSAFGFIPDLDDDELGIATAATLVPFMEGIAGAERYEVDTTTLDYAIRSTKWDGIDLIPANMDLFYTEIELVSKHLRGELEFDLFKRLDDGLNTINHKYDVILIDSPPSLGSASINIMNAADGIIVPCPPRIHDFSSTVQFFRMIETIMSSQRPDKPFYFLKVLITMYDKRKTKTQLDLKNAMETMFDMNYRFETIIPASSDIENAFAEFQSPLEYKHIKNKQVTETLKILGSEVSDLIMDLWSKEPGNTSSTSF